MKYTLEQILKQERRKRMEGGLFGITACKQSIKFDVDHRNVKLTDLLDEYVKKANDDIFFNKTMILACWELINEKGTVK